MYRHYAFGRSSVGAGGPFDVPILQSMVPAISQRYPGLLLPFVRAMSREFVRGRRGLRPKSCPEPVHAKTGAAAATTELVAAKVSDGTFVRARDRLEADDDARGAAMDTIGRLRIALATGSIGNAVLVGLMMMLATSARAEGVGSITIAKQGHFFVGGKYYDTPQGQVFAGQAYVEFQIPENRTHPYPIIMIEGCCTSGAGFNGTADGRDGWVQYFLSKGYVVYVMDQVGRGRSPFVEAVYGEKNPKAPKFVEREFVAYERYNLFPHANLHTQWPGTGVVGDPIFDQFQASMLPDFKDRKLREPFNRDAGVALLDKIGPSLILPHSQSGPYAWLMADARPNLVKGLLMVEATGSPYYEIQHVGAPEWSKDNGLEKPFGMSRTPITYDPPARPNGLDVVRQEKADGPGLAPCWVQKEPA